MQLAFCCDHVVGLIPVYTDQGDACQVLYQNEAGDYQIFVENHPVEGVKWKLARLYALDLLEQMRQLRQQYQRSVPLPVCLFDGRILLPFKLRMPMVKGDACYGYIEYGLVRRLVPEKNHCALVLVNGWTLPVYSQMVTARLAWCLSMEIQRDRLVPSSDAEAEAWQALKVLQRFLTSTPS